MAILNDLSIWGEIQEERRKQDRMWGGPDHDDGHGPSDWLDLIEREADEGFRRIGEDDRGVMVKIAALAVAAVESYDREVERKAGHPFRGDDPQGGLGRSTKRAH